MVRLQGKKLVRPTGIPFRHRFKGLRSGNLGAPCQGFPFCSPHVGEPWADVGQPSMWCYHTASAVFLSFLRAPPDAPDATPTPAAGAHFRADNGKRFSPYLAAATISNRRAFGRVDRSRVCPDRDRPAGRRQPLGPGSHHRWPRANGRRGAAYRARLARRHGVGPRSPMRRDPPLPKRIAALVGQIRVAGMTPAAIARESGISRQTIWRIEAGEISRPSYDTIERLERLWARISIIRE